MPVEQINPPTMPANPAYAQGTVATGTRTLVVGGQNGVSADGAMAEGIAAQTTQALRNVLTVLGAAGATQSDVVRLGIYVVDTADLREGYSAVGSVWGPYPTSITVLRVAGLARPDALVEIEALALL